MTALPQRIRRLGLARKPGDVLWETVADAGWEPRSFFTTAMVPTEQAAPIPSPDAVILLSPAGARFAQLPKHVPVLATGEGTARELGDRDVWLPREPNAEGLWALLQERFPAGGDFLLIRAERSRDHFESVAKGTCWRIHPWITHAERVLDPLPEPLELDAVLALSPLQAELLGPLASHLLRFAWGERSARAFAQSGFPAHATCEPKVEALARMLGRVC